jgi:hypothetical protein
MDQTISSESGQGQKAFDSCVGRSIVPGVQYTVLDSNRIIFEYLGGLVEGLQIPKRPFILCIVDIFKETTKNRELGIVMVHLTMRRVFQIFERISLLIESRNGVENIVGMMKLREIYRKRLAILGPSYGKMNS